MVCTSANPQLLAASKEPEDLRATARFMNPLMNYFPPQVHVPLGRDCVSLLWQLCLPKLRKARRLSWHTDFLRCYWVGIHRWSPPRIRHVFGLQWEVSGTQPPAPLINKFMYEEERKRLLEGSQSVIPPSPFHYLTFTTARRRTKLLPASE